MSFAGKVWRLLVGIKDGLVLLFMLLFFALLFAILSARPSPGMVREGALLIELDGYIVEERAELDPIQALLSQQAPVTEYEAGELVRALDAAAGDERIKAVALDLSRFLGGGQVHLQEVGEALARVRAAKKPVLAYSLAYSDDALQLAAHASEVWVDPIGGAVVGGPGGAFLFFGDLLEQYGVNARVYRVGTFKSATEPYTRSEFSPEARENMASLYGALWAQWGERVAKLAGEDSWSSLPGAFAATSLAQYLADTTPSASGKPIGIITVAGEVVDGEAGPGTAGGDRIAALLDEALDDDLAALVVRIDTPGGSVTASEQIRRAVLRHQANGIPIAVSMANVAASAGYSIASAGDRIFAQPETITGSIGVFAVIPTFEATAARFGITSDGVRTTPLSGQPDIIGGFTPEVDAILQASVEDSYADFLGHVGKARKITPAALDRIAQGRVWDGGSARQIGLVDQFGGLDDALAWAAKEAKLKDGQWYAKRLGTTPSSYDSLIRQMLVDNSEDSGAASADLFALLARQRGHALQQIAQDAERLTRMQGVQAYCLECPREVQPAPTRHLEGWLAMFARLFARD